MMRFAGRRVATTTVYTPVRVPASCVFASPIGPMCRLGQRWCATTTSASPASTPSHAAASASPATPASPPPPPPLTAEERAAFCAPPTVVTASSFEQVVMQSQLAMCLTYHVDNTRCRTFLPRIEETVNEMNIRCRHRWLSLMLVDADRNPSLAGAFSVERVKLPITYFVFSGTIIDQVNGAVPKERLQAILARFMEYYQEQKGVDLIDHGFAQSAKAEAITEALSTQELEGKLEWTLLSKERDWSNHAAVKDLVTKATAAADKDLRELQDAVGMNVKRIDPADLFGCYYSKPAYIASARVAFFGALAAVVDPGVAADDAAALLRKSLADYKHGMARPAVRFAACVAQLRLAERTAAQLLGAAAAQTRDDASNNGSGADAAAAEESCAAALADVAKWVRAVDAPGGLDGLFPQDTVNEMLASYRQLGLAVRRAGKPAGGGAAAAAAAAAAVDSSATSAAPPATPNAAASAAAVAHAKATQAVVGDCIRATLQLFPEDAKCNVARSRFSAMMH